MDLSSPYRSVVDDPAAGEKQPPLNLTHHLSVTTRHRLPSKIKQAYSNFNIPGILNIAGGLPNLAFFPFDTLEAQTAKPDRWTPSPNYPGASAAPPPSLSDPQAPAHLSIPKVSHEKDPVKKIDVASSLQYGLAAGYPPLLSWTRQFTREQLHPDVPYRDGPEVVMSCGATDGFAKTLELFVDPWKSGVDDPAEREGLLCETFAYSNALSQASAVGMQIVPVKADGSGMVVTGDRGLEDVLANWDPANGKRPRLMYTVTLGLNPTGVILPVERKKEIYAVCSKYDVIIVEDEPYWYLQFPSSATEEAASRGLQPPATSSPSTNHVSSSSSSGYPFLDSLTPSFISFDTDGRVVRLDTFSKTVAPGCRLGWITAQPEFIERLTRISESTTVQPSGFVQGMVAELVIGSQHEAKEAFSLLPAYKKSTFSGWKMDGWVRWLEGLRGMYERRMNRMCRILDAGSFLVDFSSLPSPSPEDNWDVVTKTPLFSYLWPRAGMFIWLRLHFEQHPLWQFPVINSDSPHHHLLDGSTLATALMIFLTTKPYLVLVSIGALFSATDDIRAESGWAFYRLCFAAETEENIDESARRFVAGVHDFWRITDAREIEKILKDVPHVASAETGGLVDINELSGEIAKMGSFLGC
ncbi:pyridoxal phosphate-dependent transferase [Podospora didyma]|uniref:Pyridoxal phosphate-dependent transferase n=1 Tax=Podospora didyma TaxID=330526 RepID=A0AAE0KJN5_9PEZI|nr:pyridoxal phosphate-dependent transferase [Podospora didyma]